MILNMDNPSKRVTLVLALPAVLCVVMGLASAAQAEGASLQSTDCVKCHQSQPTDITTNGGKHKTELSCQDCHEGHRPTSPNNIPLCKNCHEGAKHFELEGCLNCHTNPHTPLNITLSGNLTDPCLTCHTDQREQLDTFRSKHSAKACTSCHDVHGKIPECVSCHKPHSSEMTQADCGTCHRAHQPKNVTFAATTPADLCGACHSKPLAQLAANQTKHSKLACVKCHESPHKTVPDCQKCHGEPHPAGLMAKFDNCLSCHKHPHDLNNWSAQK